MMEVKRMGSGDGVIQDDGGGLMTMGKVSPLRSARLSTFAPVEIDSTFDAPASNEKA